MGMTAGLSVSATVTCLPVSAITSTASGFSVISVGSTIALFLLASAIFSSISGF
jgi:hypothetical protein